MCVCVCVWVCVCVCVCVCGVCVWCPCFPLSISTFCSSWIPLTILRTKEEQCNTNTHTHMWFPDVSFALFSRTSAPVSATYLLHWPISHKREGFYIDFHHFSQIHWRSTIRGFSQSVSTSLWRSGNIYENLITWDQTLQNQNQNVLRCDNVVPLREHRAASRR